MTRPQNDSLTGEQSGREGEEGGLNGRKGRRVKWEEYGKNMEYDEESRKRRQRGRIGVGCESIEVGCRERRVDIRGGR